MLQHMLYFRLQIFLLCNPRYIRCMCIASSYYNISSTKNYKVSCEGISVATQDLQRYWRQICMFPFYRRERESQQLHICLRVENNSIC